MYPQQKTHKNFLKELYNRNKYYREGLFKVVSQYKKVKEKLIVNSNGENHLLTPCSLLRGSKPSHKSVVDKEKHCQNILKRKGINLKIINSKKLRRVIFETKYGNCVLPFDRLKKFKKPIISSAINKTEFMIKEFEETHGNKFDYSNSFYKNAKTKIKIRCKKHGYFEQGYSQHKNGMGCPKCSDISRKIKTKSNGGWSPKDWEIKANKSKNFHSFKFYIIKCWNNEEVFYKVGRTFLKIKKRFPTLNSMPYKYKILELRESYESLKIWYLEKSFKDENKNNKYKPKISFNGKTECFKTIIDIHNGKEY